MTESLRVALVLTSIMGGGGLAPPVRALVIRGAGEEHFSVGMDLKQLPEGVARMGSPGAVFDQRLGVIAAIENMPKPVIATLYGA